MAVFHALSPPTPPFIPLSKIDWPIHRLHTSLHQPVFVATSKSISAASWLLVQSKTNTTYWYIITFVLYFYLMKAAMRPANFPFSSFRIQRGFHHAGTFLFFPGQKLLQRLCPTVGYKQVIPCSAQYLPVQKLRGKRRTGNFGQLHLANVGNRRMWNASSQEGLWWFMEQDITGCFPSSACTAWFHILTPFQFFFRGANRVYSGMQIAIYFLSAREYFTIVSFFCEQSMIPIVGLSVAGFFIVFVPSDGWSIWPISWWVSLPSFRSISTKHFKT